MSSQEIADQITDLLYGDAGDNYLILNEGVSFIHNIASKILGVLVVVLIVGLPLIIALEVCYISFPIVQDTYSNLYERLKGKPQQALGFVLRDARMALHDAMENQTHPAFEYFKRKCVAVFICAFTVAMILGPGNFLINWLAGIIDDIVSWFSSNVG